MARVCSLLTRRQALMALAALPLAPAARASVADWLPYAADEVMVLQPFPAESVRIDPVLRDFDWPAPPGERVIEPRLTGRAPRTRGTRPLPRTYAGEPPSAYTRTAKAEGVAPWLLFGVALQESQLAFGKQLLPWPWTLCVQGQGERHADFAKTLAALNGYVRQGVTNVDCGAMQVNWYWHGDKLGDTRRALDPHANLAVGARILRGHFDARRSWRKAVALYHTGADDTPGKLARGSRYANQTLQRLARLGVHIPTLLQGRGDV